MAQYDEKYWNKRFNGNEPEQVIRAVKRLYGSYPKECLPQGLCDPMYIMNTVCLELGVGDGQGNFYLPEGGV